MQRIVRAPQAAQTGLPAHDSIPVAVAHVAVRRMRARDRGDSVLARLGAGDSPVSVVVVARERILATRR